MIAVILVLLVLVVFLIARERVWRADVLKAIKEKDHECLENILLEDRSESALFMVVFALFLLVSRFIERYTPEASLVVVSFWHIGVFLLVFAVHEMLKYRRRVFWKKLRSRNTD